VPHHEVIASVRGLAAALGLPPVHPVVLADRSNLVLGLDPLPIVARIAMATSAARVGMDWLAREVEVSRFLGPGLSTVPVDEIDPGPHRAEGLVISFWKRERLLAERVDPAEAGRMLSSCHQALLHYPQERLPHLGAWEEVRSVKERVREGAFLSLGDHARIERAFERAERIWEGAPSRTASMQALHGDAHLGNVLASARGPLWTDWEDAFVGPVEYDLACLRSRAELFGEDREAIERATAAYGSHVDAQLVSELGTVRNVQVVVWLALFAERQPELLPRLRARIEKL
jgi:Phosphotransferase enzyme family